VSAPEEGVAGALSPRSSQIRRGLAFGVRLAIAIAVLAWLIHALGGTETLLEHLLALPVTTLVAVLLVNTLDRLLMAYKWLRLLRTTDEALSVLEATKIYCASMVWGMFLPATVGADAVRVVSVHRRGVAASRAVASILVERALGFLASLLLALVGLAVVATLGEPPPMMLAVMAGVAAVLLAGAVLVGALLSDRAFGWLDARAYGPLARFRGVGVVRRVHQSYRSFREHPAELRVFFALSLVEQLVPAVSIWLLVIAFGDAPSVLYVAAAVAIAYVVARVPVSLGGIGVLEGSLIFLLVLGGMSGEHALAVSVAARLLEVASWLPWWGALIVAEGTPRPPPAARL
jgi:glycosyltransferase 2 family protein